MWLSFLTKRVIGSATLEKIAYTFWHDKFCGVVLYTKGFSNWNGLKNAVFEKFGKGYQNNEYLEEYSWFGEKTNISLDYNDVAQKAMLWISSKQMTEEMRLYDTKKAQEGASKGF